MTARLRETYDNQVFNALKEKFQYKNVMEVPKLVKITINMGLGEAKDNAKVIESAVEEIALISGQRPVVTKARKSIANFKVRQGMPVGAKVTLRPNYFVTLTEKNSIIKQNITYEHKKNGFSYPFFVLKARPSISLFPYILITTFQTAVRPSLEVACKHSFY